LRLRRWRQDACHANLAAADPNDVNLNDAAGVSRVTDILRAAECNKAPFMYEMKGALSGHGPDQPVSRPHGSGSASRPASPFP
jgi:hypothetical protein